MTGALDQGSGPAPRSPDVMATSSCVPDISGSCALCGDEALPARVLEVRDATGVARVAMLAMDGTIAPANPGLDVALDLVDGVGVGDIVLVHQGFAISRVETS